MRFSQILLASAIASVAVAIDKTPPIPERHPGWGEGKNKQLIEFEVFYDLTCSASAALHPEFKKFLDLKFLNGTVRDAIRVNYAFFPLPYHHASWIPHKLLPYIIDKCVADPLGCKFPYYMDFTFYNQNLFLTGKDTTYNDLITQWTGMVSSAFNWPMADLNALYSWDTDHHNSEMRTRYNWKYSASQGVSATPSMAVNGIQLQEPPFDAKSLLKLLNDVYNAQIIKQKQVQAQIAASSFLEE